MPDAAQIIRERGRAGRSRKEGICLDSLMANAAGRRGWWAGAVPAQRSLMKGSRRIRPFFSKEGGLFVGGPAKRKRCSENIEPTVDRFMSGAGLRFDAKNLKAFESAVREPHHKELEEQLVPARRLCRPTASSRSASRAARGFEPAVVRWNGFVRAQARTFAVRPKCVKNEISADAKTCIIERRLRFATAGEESVNAVQAAILGSAQAGPLRSAGLRRSA